MRTLLGGRNKPQKLRHLAQQHLGTDIQSGEHDPVEDARAALALYQKHRDGWERWVAKGGDTHARGKTGSQKTGAGVGATHEGVAQLDMARRSKGPLGAERLAELATRDYMADL